MKFLKTYLEYITEKAVSADEVLVKPNIGLVVYERNTSIQKYISLVLYDFKNSKIEGYVKLSKFKSDDFYNLYQIFAKDKHGPLMYELAMSYISPTGIVPSSKIKKKALKVWDIFDKDDNIIKDELDPNNDSFVTSFDYDSTETDQKDETILKLLNQVYRIKHPIEELKDLLFKGVKLCTEYGIKNSILASVAEKEFKSIYNSVEA